MGCSRSASTKQRTAARDCPLRCAHTPRAYQVRGCKSATLGKVACHRRNGERSGFSSNTSPRRANASICSGWCSMMLRKIRSRLLGIVVSQQRSRPCPSRTIGSSGTFAQSSLSMNGGSSITMLSSPPIINSSSRPHSPLQMTTSAYGLASQVRPSVCSSTASRSLARTVPRIELSVRGADALRLRSLAPGETAAPRRHIVPAHTRRESRWKPAGSTPTPVRHGRSWPSPPRRSPMRLRTRAIAARPPETNVRHCRNHCFAHARTACRSSRVCASGSSAGRRHIPAPTMSKHAIHAR